MTDTIVLRAVEVDDLEFTRRTRNDAEVNSLTLGRRFPITEVGERQWFERLGAGSFPVEATFIVADVATRRPLGLVALSDIDWINGTAWFGIWIAPEHQGAGRGLQATAATVAYARDRLGLRRLKLLVLADHSAAIRMYESLGFHEEGRLKEEILESGVTHDVLLLACSLSETGR